MNIRKACQLKEIPTKIIKINADIFANSICIHFNYCIDIGDFLQAFNHADITPLHTKEKQSDKTNYRHVSLSNSMS